MKIGQETQKLYPELGKIGRPSAVYSTPTTKTHDNKCRSDKDRSAKGGVPWGLPAFPKDFWFQVQGGEAVAGFFRYPTGEDAVFVANHTPSPGKRLPSHWALAPGTSELASNFLTAAPAGLEMKVAENRYAFDLQPGGGEFSVSTADRRRRY